MRHVRIQAAANDLFFQYRSAALPEVSRTTNAYFENRGWAVRIRISHVRLPEVRSHSHIDYFERSNGSQHAWLALSKVTASGLESVIAITANDRSRT
jgi:hypothetical protein